MGRGAIDKVQVWLQTTCFPTRRLSAETGRMPASARPLGVGGLDHAKSQALERMRGIVKVCQAAARAKFPSFDVVASFKIFNLEAGPSDSTDLLDVVSLSGRRKQVEASDSLERLAKVFQVACNQLVIEFELLRTLRTRISRQQEHATERRGNTPGGRTTAGQAATNCLHWIQL